MNWAQEKGLSTRIAQLPGVLAGPILRQVTATSVTVWFALRMKATVTVTIYQALPNSTSTGETIKYQVISDFNNPVKEPTTALGSNLHVVAVTTPVPAPGMVEGNIYAYDAVFAWDVGDLGHDLSTATGKPQAIGTVAGAFSYPPYTRPTFCIPPKDLNKLKIIHGSCRKPHGEGTDALAYLDQMILDTAKDPVARPHQLLLTGDQIYADDVADVLLLMLTDAGKTLLGWEEKMPFGVFPQPTDATDLPTHVRGSLLKAVEFTSDDLKSHLLFLGEFLSMYLFAWSDTLWPQELPVAGDVLDSMLNVIKILPAEQLEIMFDQSERNSIKVFQTSLPDVRRALANIPSYMICDDHEVTDDWNMTRRFCDRIYGTTVGIRVVQNALVAFSVCQAWGNRPDQFKSTTTPGGSLLKTLADVSAAAGASAAYDRASDALQKIVGIHPPASIRAKQRVYHEGNSTPGPNGPVNSDSLRFDFRIEGAGHLILVTDTRTWRAYPSKSGDDGHADFLMDPELALQLYVDPQRPLDDRLLIVVLTTNAPPIRSFRFAAANPYVVDALKHPGETAQEAFEAFLVTSDVAGMTDLIAQINKTPIRGKARSVYEEDLYDSWDFPSSPFDRLILQLDALLKKQGQTQQMILLSGDVHASFASRLTCWSGDGTGAQSTPRLVVAQLVASALKNQKRDTIAQQKDGYMYIPINLKTVTRAKGTDVFPFNFEPEFFARNNVSAPPDAPDRRYRLDYLVASETGQNPPHPIQVSDSDHLANYKNAALAQLALDNSGGAPRQIIGHNNIAELTFIWNAGVKRVYHTLHWRDAVTNDDGTLSKTATGYWTRYDVSLNLDDPDFGPYPSPKKGG